MFEAVYLTLQRNKTTPEKSIIVNFLDATVLTFAQSPWHASQIWFFLSSILCICNFSMHILYTLSPTCSQILEPCRSSRFLNASLTQNYQIPRAIVRPSALRKLMLQPAKSHTVCTFTHIIMLWETFTFCMYTHTASVSSRNWVFTHRTICTSIWGQHT